MNRKKVDLSDERQIIINMIVSSKFLKEIVPIVKAKYFESFYAQIVSNWIIEYWQEFKEAPNKNIQKIYQQKINQIKGEEENEIIKEFLLSISKEWEKNESIQNIEYSIKSAIRYLKLRSLQILKEDLESSLLEGDPTKGEHYVSTYARIDHGNEESVSIFQDSAIVSNAFMQDDEILFQFPGVLGKCTGNFLRGDLVAFLGVMKSGKTHALWYTGRISMMKGWRVLFITLEMPRRQMIRRAWQSMVSSPKKTMEITIPKFIPIDEGKFKWDIELIKEKRSGVDTTEIKKKQKKFKFLFRSGNARILSMPAYSTKVSDICVQIDNIIHYKNFIPDVLIIDYADLLSADGKISEYRHQLDNIWKGLRKLAHEKEMLVVTASQSGRKGFNSDLTEMDTAEDVRKLAHVSKMIAINRTKADKEKHRARVELLVEREEEQSVKKCTILQCLDIGAFCLDSQWDNEVKK